MDIEDMLRKLGKTNQLNFENDRVQVKKIEERINSRIKRKGLKLFKLPIPAIVTLLAITIIVPSWMGWNISQQKGMNSVTMHSSLSIENNDAVNNIIEILHEYSDIEVNDISNSQLTNVFLSVEKVVQLETNKGQIDVAIFPETVDVESVKLVEDFSVPGNITYTFTGLDIKEESTPLKASGPNYLFKKNHTLFLTNNSAIVKKLHDVYYLIEVHDEIFHSFGLNIDDYHYYRPQNNSKQEFGESKNNLEKLSLESMKLIRSKLKKGDLMPAIFVNKVGAQAIVIYKSSDKTNHMYKFTFDSTSDKWILKDNLSVQGVKSIPTK